MFWRGVVGYLPSNLVQGIAGLLGIVVFTRLLSPQAYGAYALGFSVMTLVHTCTLTWLEASMARFQAKAAVDGELPDHFATLYRITLALALGAPLACGLALMLWPLHSDLKVAVGAGLVAIPFRSIAKMAQERRRASGDVRASALLDVGQTGGAFLVGAALAWAGMGGAAPLMGFALAAALCALWALPRELKVAPGGRFDRARAKAYAAYGVPVSLSLILALALATADRFIIAGYLGEGAVGVYHAGYSLSNRTLDVIFIWLGAAGGPAAVAALERGGREALARQAKSQLALMLLIALPAAVGLALVARPLADVMVGPALRDGAARVTPWIAISGLCSGLTTYYFHQAFTLSRRTVRLLVTMSIPAAANIGLNLVLIPRFGLQGAMWATAASYALGLAASFAIGRRTLPLPVDLNVLVRCALACAAMAAAVLALPSPGGVGELALKAGVGACVYAILAFALDIAGGRTQALKLARLLQARPA